MKAMIFAAGLGTRLRPLTDTTPKALIPVGGTPLLDIQIKRLCEAGATDLVINVHHHADLMKEHISRLPLYPERIHISDESDCLLDTGGGIRKAAPFFEGDDQPFLVHNVDILSNVNLKDFYQRAQAYDAALLVSKRDTFRYLLFDDALRLVGWVNEKTGEVKSPYPDLDVTSCQKFAFSGIHTFSPCLFRFFQEWPDKFSIIDFYLSICSQARIQACPWENLQLLDIGKPETLPLAEDFLKNNA